MPFAERGKRTDDHVAVLRALWAEGPGHRTTASSRRSPTSTRGPRPTQANIPIVVGGHSKAAARRAGRLGDGFFPGKGDHEELAELIDVDAARPPSSTAATPTPSRSPPAATVPSAAGALEEVKALADLGVSAG